VLRWAIAEIKGDLNRISFTHIEQLLDLADGQRGCKTINLPQQIKAKKGYHTLELTRSAGAGTAGTGTTGSSDYELAVPGLTLIPPLQLKIEAKIILRGQLLGYPKADEAALDWDKLNPPLRIRFRKPGDRFHPLGMQHNKKLQDLFIDLKVPAAQRDNIPLLTAGEEILWVAGIRISERYKITPHTKQVLWLRLIKAASRPIIGNPGDHQSP
jgi:tRNA(Ile)-lysidine synthase